MTQLELLAVNKSPKVEVLDRDIFYIKDLINWGGALVDVCNDVDAWAKAMVSKSGNRREVAISRVCHEVEVSKLVDARLGDYETAIFNAIGAGGRLCTDINPYFWFSLDSSYSFLRYQEGHFCGEHVDHSLHTEGPARVVSAIMYPNDDYEGGEIIFPRQEITLKPEAGSMVMFPSNWTHPHGVLEVTKGTRYAMVTWMK